MNAIAERWIGGCPPRTPGPHPDLESEPSAADLAPVRDPPQSAPAAPLAPLRRPAETATATGHPRAASRTKTDSRRWHDQRISPGRVTWMRLSAPTRSASSARRQNGGSSPLLVAAQGTGDARRHRRCQEPSGGDEKIRQPLFGACRVPRRALAEADDGQQQVQRVFERVEVGRFPCFQRRGRGHREDDPPAKPDTSA